MADHESSSPKLGEETPKKPFEPPRLQVYGDIATLTRTIGRTGVPDGGHGSKANTSP